MDINGSVPGGCTIGDNPYIMEQRPLGPMVFQMRCSCCQGDLLPDLKRNRLDLECFLPLIGQFDYNFVFALAILILGA